MGYVFACICCVAATLIICLSFFHKKYIAPLSKQYEKMNAMQTKMLGIFSDFEDMAQGFEEYAEEVKSEISAAREELMSGREIVGKALLDLDQSKSSLAGHKEKIESMMSEVKSDVADFKKEVGLVSVMQKELREGKNRLGEQGGIAQAKESEKSIPKISAAEIGTNIHKRPIQVITPRQKQIIDMFNEGLTAAQIARTTGFSKGEVELILEMRRG